MKLIIPSINLFFLLMINLNILEIKDERIDTSVLSSLQLPVFHGSITGCEREHFLYPS